MLLRFEASNHRSIMAPVEFSMIAVDKQRPATRSFEGLSEEVLVVGGIYGPNASGKTNVLDGLAWLSAAVRSSLRRWGDFVPRVPFKFGKGPGSPSHFDVELMVDEIRCHYHLEVSSTVLYEALFSYPKGRRRMLFEREGTKVKFRRGLAGLAGTQELLTPTTLALSAAMRMGQPEIGSVGRAIARISTHGFRPSGPFWWGQPFGHGSTWRLFHDDVSYHQANLFEEEDLGDPKEAALALLRFADLGIDDVKIEEEETEGKRGGRRRRLLLQHRVSNQAQDFDWDDESTGTQTWFQLIGPTLSALRGGQLLLFDEIDASLHPLLTVLLLKLFQDPETNPHGAQLVFTTHNASLLNNLNRDEVWLTEKSDDGSTKLTALADYGGDKVRKSTNLERAYLQGRFGALPRLDSTAVNRALSTLGEDV